MDKLIDKTAELFDTSEKFENYLELVNLKSAIINKWGVDLQNNISEYFNKPEDIIEGWNLEYYTKDAVNHFRFYPESLKNVFSLNLYHFKDFNFWLNANLIDSQKFKSIVKDSKYEILTKTYRNDNDKHAWFLFQEIGNFNFDDSYQNGSFINPDKFIWYAYHYQDTYLEQLKNKVDKLRTLEIIPLLIELYETCKGQ